VRFIAPNKLIVDRTGVTVNICSRCDLYDFTF